MILFFPVIDRAATGKNLLRLRKERGFSVRELQDYLGLEEPRAIYQWQSGQRLASVPHLYALSYLLDTPMEELLICVKGQLILPDVDIPMNGQAIFCHLLWSQSAQAFLPCRLSIPLVVGTVQ